MTAAVAPAGSSRNPDRQASGPPWRQLARVTLRQHRTALLWIGMTVAVMAIALAATGISLHQLAARGGPGWYGHTRASVDYGGVVLQVLAIVLQVLPLLAGMFIGAPLVPREIEHGTAKLAWTQAASRQRWLLAQVLPVAALLALAAVGLSAEFAWWQAPLPALGSTSTGAWSPQLFNVSPLLLPGWTVFAFALGLFLGTAARRTLPAIAATLLCYGALLREVAYSWRMHYLAPLHRAFTVTFRSDNTYSWTASWGNQHPIFMSQALGWRNGRLLAGPDFSWPIAWLRAHHIVMWMTYQPVGRYHAIVLIEFGWLIAASVILIAAAVYLTRRRPA